MLAIAMIFVLLNINSIWSQSVDLSHHYALAYRLYEQWGRISPSDASLESMTIYPRGSHLIAALFGALLGSTFLGIQITALISLALLWLCAILILNSLPGNKSSAALTTLLILLIVNKSTLKFDLHGHEIVGNFFYSQLVGCAVLFAAMLLAIKIEKTRGVLWACVALFVLMFVNATIHLLPAIEILGLIGGLLVVDVLFEHDPDKSTAKKVAYSMLLTFVSVAGILLHPSFSAMRELSRNNGALELRSISYPVGLIVLCVVVATTSIVLFLRWARTRGRGEIGAVKYLSIYGVVVVALCLLQYALTFVGQGSEYAVKKYGFSLTTVLVLQLTIIAGDVLAPKVTAFIGNNASNFRLSHVFLLCVTLVTALFLNVPHGKVIDVPTIVRMEKELINISSKSVPPAGDGKYNVIIGLPGVLSEINYMFSIAILKTPFQLAVHDVLLNNRLGDLSKYSYVISSAQNKAYGLSSCDAGISDGVLSVIPVQCVEKKRPALAQCSNGFDFSANGEIPAELLNGFSAPEPSGRWSDGTVAHFECFAVGSNFKKLRIQAAPFIYGSLRSQDMEVEVNGVVTHKEIISTYRGSNNPIIIDLPEPDGQGKYVFQFKFPNAASPKSVGYNDDVRVLAVSFEKMTFEK
jgi:hypothetical protein